MDLIKSINYSCQVVVIFGVLGNVLAFVVCSRSKLAKTIFSTYYRFLVSIDTFTLIFHDLRELIQNETGLYVSTVSDDLCRLVKITEYIIPATSGWILVAISLDRLISIKFPTRFGFRKKRSFQMGLCFILTAKDFLLYSQAFFSGVITYTFDNSTRNQTEKFCQPKSVDFRVLSWIDLFNMSIIPFLLMLACSALMIAYLIETRRNISTSNVTNPSERKKRDRKFALNAIGINLIFICTNLPLAVMFLFSNYFEFELELSKAYLYRVLLLLAYVNFSSTFYVNVAVNSIFREEFLSLVFCRPSKNS
jgi:hypothetical protein